jgi:hypothetical protein
VDYQRTKAGMLVPRQVVNPQSAWYTGSTASVPMDDEESQYRTVTSHENEKEYSPAMLAAARLLTVHR